MRDDPKLEMLAGVGLFSACNKRELATIARLCTELPFEDGFVLTKQGAPGIECFVIASGEAKVLCGGQEVAKIGPGDCVGEMALLDGGRRAATVVATTPIKAWVMNIREFRSVLDTSPTVSRKIMVTLARRLRNAETDRPH
jgi:CRP/FNR family transcriptional regulator, cyclic AMP receptor protein